MEWNREINNFPDLRGQVLIVLRMDGVVAYSRVGGNMGVGSSKRDISHTYICI